MADSPKIRLYIDAPMGAGLRLPLSPAHSHYLGNVMRMGAGDCLSVFNGMDGQWQARIAVLGRKNGELVCEMQTAPQGRVADVWLLFAPIKKARTDFIVEKAAEMGMARICPITTDYSQTARIARARLVAHVVEAAEQCGGTTLSVVDDLARLSEVLAGWDTERRILFCDERMAGESASGWADLSRDSAGGLLAGKWAILIGPEGGFSAGEKDMLSAHPSVYRVGLGPRILRADTAAVAAMALLTIND